MAFFLRGHIRLESQFLTTIPHAPTRVHHRFFTSSSFLRNTSRTILKGGKEGGFKPKTNPRIGTNSAPNAPSPYTAQRAARPLQPIYTTYAHTLGQKPHPTLLYQAPSHTIFILASYSGALFCFSYAAYNLNVTYFNPPADLAPWVSYSFAGICFLMSCFGGYLLLSPARVINTVKAIPTASISKRAARTGPAKTGKPENSVDASRAPPLLIEVELRKMFPVPFFPARKIVASLQEVSLPVKLNSLEVEAAMAARERDMANKLSKEQKEKWENNIMSRPFQLMGRGFVTAFNGMARAWTREGFLKMEVKGQRYKLDVNNAWVLDNGKAIDRLVQLKPY